MSDVIQATLEANAAAAVAPVVLTKEEKIAKIDAQIAKLQARKADIEAGKPVAPKAVKKAPFVPEVGGRVIATVGRNTATTQAKIVEGTVLAIKLSEDEGKTAGLARVRFGEGFDEQVVTLPFTSLQAAGDKHQADAEAAEAASMGSIATNPAAAPAFVAGA